MCIDSVSIVTAFYITPSQEALYMHYEKIESETNIPIILYNIPSRTGVRIEPETAAKLSKLERIVAIKDSSGDIENIKAYNEQCQDGFCVLAGSDGLILDNLKLGGSGAIAATSNIFPELVVSIYKNFISGNLDCADIAQKKLIPLRENLSMGTVPGVLKQAVNLVGSKVGTCRKPISELSGDKLDAFTKMLEKEYEGVK